MNFQSFTSLNKYLNGVITRKQKHGITPSLSALFRNARKKKYISAIGDFPILTHCLDVANRNGVLYTRQKLNYALNQSEELSKEKKSTKKQLLNIWEEHQSKTRQCSNQNAIEGGLQKGEQRN